VAVPRIARALTTGALMALGTTLAACGGDAPPASSRSWAAYNRARTGWTTEGRRAVERTAATLADRLGCSGFATEAFRAWAKTYRAGRVPLPLAAGSCDLTGGEGETLLIEAFGTEPPTVADALDARSRVICPLVRKEGLPGQPWVRTRDRVLIQPDRPDTARRIAGAFPGAEHGSVCPEATRRFFERLRRSQPPGPATTGPEEAPGS